ncbi:hypothetical protein BU25DRAFT_69504 [Macroventuria anomochaeta]|uniref:Uncharacterized protein n=1 Tax=Macroventuria anomochaeta TaxID=301207 RepID=A0ACB6S126_9PLEO|nr:uncharacterized protein BU25DRAFT_69504 [Macroventuria anomochaeta]KAF2627089.1 hypothetical protein BU25DRAFT_69504 [Macroventuria anomochaeta]
MSAKSLVLRHHYSNAHVFGAHCPNNALCWQERCRLDRSPSTFSERRLPRSHLQLVRASARSYRIAARLGRRLRGKERMMTGVSFCGQALAKRWPLAPLHPSSCASGPLETPYHPPKRSI